MSQLTPTEDLDRPSGWWGLLIVVPVLLAALPGSPPATPRPEIAPVYALPPPSASVPPRDAVIRRKEPASPADVGLGRPARLGRVSFTWPVSAPLGSRFGPRRDGWHAGIDLLAERGTPIRAAATGVVVASGWEHAYGRVVKIWHADELMTVYAHNQENYVKTGDWVEVGQVIGTVGSTGRATAPHLHFEIRIDGKKYDPRYWLPPRDDVDWVAAAPGRATR
jgi:murein DD-endopeptidase MepM/ murein hydrolase activator NlpD